MTLFPEGLLFPSVAIMNYPNLQSSYAVIRGELNYSHLLASPVSENLLTIFRAIGMTIN